MADEILWIFLHLPKSGGTTFKGHAFKHKKWDEVFIEFSNWGRSYRTKNNRPDFADRIRADRCKAEYLFGHGTYYGIHKLVPGKFPRYITFVRDPADRCASLYNFRLSRGATCLNFEDWYEQEYKARTSNPMTHFYAERLANRKMEHDDTLVLNLAKSILERCWYVGTTDNLNDDLKYLFGQMGLPEKWENYRVAGQSKNGLKGLNHPSEGEVVSKYIELDAAMREQIYQDSTLDLKLYQWVKRRKLNNPPEN
jgi:hypothetical protein